jgi:hypothetical protein
MNWITDRFSTIGGAGGGIAAYLMNISLSSTAEIALYALVGSLIGEAIKEVFSFFKKRNAEKNGQ